MKSFKNFLKETWGNYIALTTRHKEVVSNNSFPHTDKHPLLGSRISETPTHSFYHGKDGDDDVYRALNKKTGHIDARFNGQHKKTGFDIDLISTRAGSDIKAHYLIHHLATEHNLKTTVGSLSPGAIKTWQRLSQHPDLNVHGINGEGKKVKIDLNNPTTYHDNTPYEASHDPNHTGNIKIVVSRKRK
jgi:hypothetical protein